MRHLNLTFTYNVLYIVSCLIAKARLVVGEGFEPSKSMTADLQSAPFGRSGTPPNFKYLIGAGTKSRTRDLLITSQLLYQLSYAGIKCCAF